MKLSPIKNGLISLQTLKAADDETLTGSGVDTLGYAGVTFIAFALKGEILSFSVKAQQDSASNFATAADLAGTATAFATAVATDGLATLEIINPAERYVRPIITVPDAAAATPTGCIAILWGNQYLPESNVGELHYQPAEGTA